MLHATLWCDDVWKFNYSIFSFDIFVFVLQKNGLGNILERYSIRLARVLKMWVRNCSESINNKMVAQNYRAVMFEYNVLETQELRYINVIEQTISNPTKFITNQFK